MRLALALLVFTSVACGQETVPAARPAGAQIKLDVVVTPGSGLPVPGLRQQDFTLLDNKVPVPITRFQASSVAQAPVQAILVIDTLNIPLIGVGREQGEIAKFLRANGGHLAVPTVLTVFSEKGFEALGGPTQDGNALASTLAGANFTERTIRRSQGVYGAEDRYLISVNALEQLVTREGARVGRKMILWVSPGWPLLSGPGIQLESRQQKRVFQNVVDLSTQMRQARVTLYSLDSYGVGEPLGRALYYQDFLKGVSNDSQVAIGDLALQVLAVQSGGLALSSTGVADLLEKCVADARAYYEISFAALPAEKRDEYHHVEVKVAEPGMVARARQGYYAEP
jgi:VWFA-related protein